MSGVTAARAERPRQYGGRAGPLAFRCVYLKTMRDQRRSLVGWSIGMVLLVGVEALVWPSFRDMTGMKELIKQYPDYMKKLFDIESMTTGIGFMNAELFTLLLPALFLIFAIGRGARLVAGEEDAGTLDVLLVTPLSARRIVLEKALALLTSVLALGAVLWAVTLAFSLLLGMGIDPAEAATGVLAQVLLGAEFGAVALAVGTGTGRRSAAVWVPSGLAVASYVLHAAALLVPGIDPWQKVSPFYQALSTGPLGAGLPPSYLWLALVTLVAVIAALGLLDRRDIDTAG